MSKMIGIVVIHCLECCILPRGTVVLNKLFKTFSNFLSPDVM